MMGRLFTGLCRQGCWTCLDEFNRIDIEVLSVIAQQLLQVRKALLQNLTEFQFEANFIGLKPEFGVHVTMNPGYAGRTELPQPESSLQTSGDDDPELRSHCRNYAFRGRFRDRRRSLQKDDLALQAVI